MFSFNKGKNKILIAKYQNNNGYKNIYLNDTDPENITKSEDKNNFDDIKFKNGKINFEPFETDQRKIIYISAPSNAGKSFFAADLMKKYKKKYKKNKIILITPENQKKNPDKCFKNINFSQLNISDNYCDEPLTLNNLKNCLVVLDDIEGLETPEIEKDIYKLLNDILFLGRKRNISCILCNHVVKNYNKTKGILVEMDYVVIFPKMANSYIYDSLIKNDLKLPKKMIDVIYNEPSRAIIIHSKCPNFILSRYSLFKI